MANHSKHARSSTFAMPSKSSLVKIAHGVGSAVLLGGDGSSRLRGALAGSPGGGCGGGRRGCRGSRAAAACQQDTACSQRSSRKDEFQTNIHKRFPSFVVKILRPGRPKNCRPKTPR